MLIIPNYNERANISSLVERISGKVTAEPILFVDDNSSDGTSTEIQRLQNHDPGIHLLVRAGKGGFRSYAATE